MRSTLHRRGPPPMQRPPPSSTNRSTAAARHRSQDALSSRTYIAPCIPIPDEERLSLRRRTRRSSPGAARSPAASSSVEAGDGPSSGDDLSETAAPSAVVVPAAQLRRGRQQQQPRTTGSSGSGGSAAAEHNGAAMTLRMKTDATTATTSSSNTTTTTTTPATGALGAAASTGEPPRGLTARASTMRCGGPPSSGGLAAAGGGLKPASQSTTTLSHMATMPSVMSGMRIDTLVHLEEGDSVTDGGGSSTHQPGKSTSIGKSLSLFFPSPPQSANKSGPRDGKSKSPAAAAAVPPMTAEEHEPHNPNASATSGGGGGGGDGRRRTSKTTKQRPTRLGAVAKPSTPSGGGPPPGGPLSAPPGTALTDPRPSAAGRTPSSFSAAAQSAPPAEVLTPLRLPSLPTVLSSAGSQGSRQSPALSRKPSHGTADFATPGAGADLEAPMERVAPLSRNTVPSRLPSVSSIQDGTARTPERPLQPAPAASLSPEMPVSIPPSQPPQQPPPPRRTPPPPQTIHSNAPAEGPVHPPRSPSTRGPRDRSLANSMSPQPSRPTSNNKNTNGGSHAAAGPSPAGGCSGRVPRELRNFGATCYMNATLQCIMHTPHLLARLTEDTGRIAASATASRRQSVAVGGGVLSQGGRLQPYSGGGRGAMERRGSYLAVHMPASSSVVELGQAAAPASTPAGQLLLSIKGAAASFNSEFSGNGQNDAHEFLRTILNVIHEEVNRGEGRGAPYEELKDIERESEEDAMARWMRRLNKVDDSTVYDLFGGVLRSRCVCLRCGFVSMTFDPFLDLSLPMAPAPPEGGGGGSAAAAAPQALDIILREAFCEDTEESLSGGNQLLCERCKALRDGTRCVKVLRWPQVLVLHLKRFDDRGRKNRSPVVYPQTFMVNRVRYRLFGVCCHSGTENFGHYTSYVSVASQPPQMGASSPSTATTSPTTTTTTAAAAAAGAPVAGDWSGGGLSNSGSPVTVNAASFTRRLRGEMQRWYLCNDNNISEVDAKEVVSALETAYILFYSRQ